MVAEILKDNEFYCPRRDGGIASSTFPGPDRWEQRGQGQACSYCGSSHPDEFMAAIKSGIPVCPTDKSYKAYYGGTRKFYFYHLSREQMMEFVNLYNTKTMKLDYPGHFYVMPFFMTKGRKKNEQP